MSRIGDFNNDGIAGTMGDLSYLVSNLNTINNTEDLNGDGILDASDVDYLVNHIEGVPGYDLPSHSINVNINLTKQFVENDSNIAINLTKPHISHNQTFNKIKIVRTSNNPYDDRFTFTELQTWVIDPSDNILKNYSGSKCQSISNSPSGYDNDHGDTREDYNNYNPINGKWGDYDEVGLNHKYWSNKAEIGLFWMITFTENISIKDLASVVLINDFYSRTRILGVTIQLLDDNDIIYSYEIENNNKQSLKEMRDIYPGHSWYRFDGPAISNVSDASFSLIESNTKIVTNTNKITSLLPSMTSDYVDFNQFKLDKNGIGTGQYSDSYMHVFEIQIWVYVDGTLTNVALTSTAYTNHLWPNDGRISDPSNAINNKIIVNGGGWGNANDDTDLGGYWHGGLSPDAYLLITTLNSHKFSDLAAIVVYNRHDAGRVEDRIRGMAFQIIDKNNKIIATYPLLSSSDVYRIDGPAFSNVPTDFFTKGDDTIEDGSNNIANTTSQFNTLVLDTLSYNIPTSFNRIQMTAVDGRSFNLYELQVWILDNNGALKNIATDSTTRVYTNSLIRTDTNDDYVRHINQFDDRPITMLKDGDLSTRFTSYNTFNNHLDINMIFEESIELSNLVAIVLYNSEDGDTRRWAWPSNSTPFYETTFFRLWSDVHRTDLSHNFIGHHEGTYVEAEGASLWSQFERREIDRNKDGKICYTFEFTQDIITNRLYFSSTIGYITRYRFDGPAISRVPLNAFSCDDSVNRIRSIENGFITTIGTHSSYGSIVLDSSINQVGEFGSLQLNVTPYRHNENIKTENIVTINGDGSVLFNTKAPSPQQNYGKMKLHNNFIYFGANKENSCYIGRGRAYNYGNNKFNDLIITNHDENTIVIYVGSSVSKIKTVTLPYPDMIVSSTPVNAQNSGWPDTFSVSVSGTQLTVTRTDEDVGWGQPLELNAALYTSPNAADIRIFAKYSNDGGSTLSIDRDGANNFGVGRVIVTNYTAPSDNRLKHNEKLITNALENIRQLKSYRYWKTQEMYDENHHFDLDASGYPINELGHYVPSYIEDGFIAQDVKEIENFSSFASEKRNGDLPYCLNYNNIFVNATVALQELDQLHTNTKKELDDEIQKITLLEEEQKTLETQLSSILDRLIALESN